MNSLLNAPDAAGLLQAFGREAVKQELREAIEHVGREAGEILRGGAARLATRFTSSLVRVVNGTGVLLHTNLGRAPLCDAARQAVASVAHGYSTLEYDPASGDRGKRQDHVRSLARDVFGCEDVIAVNNNASAVFLGLSALARGRRVLISRGELVAIGGSFQIPAILEESGARLAEVGTTNRTTIDDYRRGLSGDVAMILTVHPSNYEIRGFTARPLPAELADLAREAGIPWLHDQGTGCVEDLREFGVPHEPTVASCLADGATLVTFSGDKLFGGPQAGFAVGRADAVATLARHPVARVVRPDKLTFAALHATLAEWRAGRWRDLPIYRAAGSTLAELDRRGEAILEGLSSRGGISPARLEPSLALFGGGTSPEKTFPSRALAISDRFGAADDTAAWFRARKSPIVARVEDGLVKLDLRTIFPEEDHLIIEALDGLLESRAS